MREPERKAYICYHKDHQGLPQRVFLLPGDTEPPRCGLGHVMTRQPNTPQTKKGTKR